MSQTQYATAPRHPREKRAELVHRYFMAAPRPPVRPDRTIPVLLMVVAILPLLLGLSLLGIGPQPAILPLSAAIAMGVHGYLRLSRADREWEQAQSAYQSARATYGNKPSGAHMDLGLG